jgi:hypothetical protein
MKKTAPRLLGLCIALAFAAAHAATDMPRIVAKDGRHALMVDGAPFLILGGQAHNSSNYPAALPKVWAALEDAHANTLEIPVAWEQVEAKEGQFDFSYVDTLVDEARKHDKRLVLLWFGAWKNTGSAYTPEWVKFNNARFPRMIDKDGKTSYGLSPLGEATLAADRKAFVALMEHIRRIDGERKTVIMVQVENEVGTYGVARDYGKRGEAAFRQPVPAAVLARQKPPAGRPSRGSWAEVYGDYADQYFHSFAIASYIEELAKAGRAVYDLPMYVNNALRDPLDEPATPWKKNFASGGPTHDVLGIYQAAAPHIDFAGPDIYMPESNKVGAILRQFQTRDNALMVPEMGNGANYARYVYQIIGKGALGVAPFGFDYAEYSNYPLGARHTDKRMIEPFAKVYAAFAPMQRCGRSGRSKARPSAWPKATTARRRRRDEGLESHADVPRIPVRRTRIPEGQERIHGRHRAAVGWRGDRADRAGRIRARRPADPREADGQRRQCRQAVDVRAGGRRALRQGRQVGHGAQLEWGPDRLWAEPAGDADGAQGPHGYLLIITSVAPAQAGAQVLRSASNLGSCLRRNDGSRRQ